MPRPPTQTGGAGPTTACTPADFFDRPAVEIQLKDSRRLGGQLAQRERILVQWVMVDPDGKGRIGSGDFLVTPDYHAPTLDLDAAASMDELRHHIGRRSGQRALFV